MEQAIKFLTDFLVLSFAVICMVGLSEAMGINAVIIFGVAVVMKSHLLKQ